MINIDYDGEEFVFDNKWDTAIPITVRKKMNSEPVIEVFPSYKDEADEFERKYSGDPFSIEALSYIWNNIGVKMRQRGYEDDKKHRDIWNKCFVIKSQNQINCDIILPTTKKLSRASATGVKNKTTFNIKLYVKEKITSYITVENNELISIAAENNAFSNDFCDETDNITEIGVETTITHRGRGFASSNAAALTKDIINNAGGYVTYEAQCDNIASAGVAVKAGFIQYGGCYYYVLRKI